MKNDLFPTFTTTGPAYMLEILDVNSDGLAEILALARDALT